MGADRTVTPEGKNNSWTTCTRPSTTPEWYFVGAEDRRTLARHAGTLWQVDHHLQPLPALAQSSGLGENVCRVADRAGRGKQCGLGNPLHRLHHSSRSPTCGWGKKSSAELEALGRSRGGFTTKIHIRCEGTGRLITFLLTPGQESDINLAENLMGTGVRFVDEMVTYVYIQNDWWLIKVTPVERFGNICTRGIFAAQSHIVQMNIIKALSINRHIANATLSSA